MQPRINDESAQNSRRQKRDANPCETKNPCLNGGTCVTVNSTGFLCHCTAFFKGNICQTKRQPCDYHFAKCVHGSTCENIDSDRFKCTCSPLYEGEFCETSKPHCEIHNLCQNSGTCFKYNSTAITCVCLPNWEGPLCEQDRNECLEDAHLCKHGGRCHNRPDGLGFWCNCSGTWYVGDLCETPYNFCTWDNSLCRNGGVCKFENKTIWCECKAPYYGKTCEKCNRKSYRGYLCKNVRLTFRFSLFTRKFTNFMHFYFILGKYSTAIQKYLV